ncbi:unnamed protein product [Cuscuta europaea]|uniref:TLC domain-containing protein n=1 Tax=Cuscuta europaea TaxID=41803 RepID=A0A9P0Z908_CUSEU|nr:unnamed protein product [Cuscuta europaea]
MMAEAYYSHSFLENKEEEHVIKTVVLSVFSWSTLFLLTTKLLSKRSFNFCNRTVSVIHASLAVTLATLSVHDWSCPFCPLASKSTPHQMRILAITVGYMIYDMGCCLSYNKLKVDDLVHHLITIVGIGAGIAYQMCGSEMVAALWIAEISSPFLHMRELLKELGYRDTILNLIADICFAAIFSFGRMVVGSYLAYVTVSANNPILIKAMAVGLLLVSAFWFYKILRMLTYKLSKKNKIKSFNPKKQ